jgi:anaerobic magnesium-protoporphyrin IX monomethyl ester cyclase
MKVGFVVDRIGHREIFSIPILSAALRKAGHEVELIDHSLIQSGRPAFARGVPDVIGYSVMTCELGTYRDIHAQLSRQYDFVPVFGGPHATFAKDFIADEDIKYVCAGEGDVAFPLFLERLGTEELYSTPNFNLKRDDGTIVRNPLTALVENLDDLPFPDRKLLFDQAPFLAQLPIKTFFSGRGCPYKCSYCFNHAYNEMYKGLGSIIRLKSVDYMIEEILEVKGAYPIDFIKFHDDIFGLKSAWLEEFADKYPRRVGVPFAAYARANMVSEKYVRLMKQAGCRTLVVGLESGDEELRNGVLRRNMTNAQLRRASELIAEAGIKLYTLNMVGLPGESREQVLKTIELNQELKPALAEFNLFKLYAGMDITQYSLDNGFVDPDFEAKAELEEDSNLRFDDAYKRWLSLMNNLAPLLVRWPSLMVILRFQKILLGLEGVIRLIRNLFCSLKIKNELYPVRIPLGLAIAGAAKVVFRRKNEL